MILMTTQDLLTEALSLPVEERAFLADILFKSLNQLDPTIDQAWLAVIDQRRLELESHKEKAVSGDKVFARLHAKFTQE